jgi:hypothetical protein
MKTNNLRKISLSLLLLGLGACSGSQSGDNQLSDNQANNDSVEVVNQSPQVTKRVVIAQISTIPTNLGVNGRSVIRVDNHTGTNLYLKSAGVGVRNDNSFAANSYGALKQSLGISGSGSNVPSTCEKLLADNHCEVFFTPSEADGSKVLSMLFEDKEGKQYHAAQLIEYSSHVPQQDGGFYLSNEHVSMVVTDSSYSLSIPYVSDGNYKSIKLSSEIGTLSQSNTCEGGAVKGTLCTAMLTLPTPRVADKNSYNNQISLLGTRSNGTLTRSFVTGNVLFNQNGHLIMSAGPAIIDARNNTTKVNVNVLNIGVASISNIAATSTYGERFFEEQTFPAGTDYKDISKTYSCTGGSTSLPTILTPAQSCTVTFTLNNLDATGSEYYKITSTGGAGGTATDSIGTRVYYRQQAIPTYGYTLSGDVNLQNTLAAGGLIEQTITLTNSGKEDLTTGSNSFTLSPAVSNLSVNPNKSTCLSSTALKANGTCTYVISYKPAVVQPLTVSKFTVIAKDKSSQSIRPERSISIRTSAVDSSNPDALSLNLTQAESNNLEIFADGKDTVIREFAVTNNGKKDFTITSITTKGWPAGLKMIGTTNAITPLWNSSNGGFNGIIKISAGQTVYFAYQYGPVSTPASGYAEQNIIGTFAGVSTTYEYQIITHYSAKVAGITTPPVGPQDFVVTDPNTLFDGSTGKKDRWGLLKQNRATVMFTYKAGSTPQSGFLVNDADLPFGFMVIPAKTTCPTATKQSPKGTLAANASCTVAYDYLSENLDHSVFYTAAVNKGRVNLRQPGYVVDNSSNGVNVLKPDNEVSFEPLSFANMSATVTSNSNKITITFTGSALSSLVTASDSIVIKPAFTASVYPESNSTCTINRTTLSCSIVVYKTASGSVTLPFTYSLSRDSDYNSFNSSVVLN